MRRSDVLQIGRLTRGAWVWSADPFVDNMEEEVFNDNQSFRFRDKFRERGSLPSGKFMEVVERQP